MRVFDSPASAADELTAPVAPFLSTPLRVRNIAFTLVSIAGGTRDVGRPLGDGLQQAALWGLLAGIFNSIPYYGPLLVTAGLSIVGFLQFGTIGMTVAVAGVSLLITTVEGSLLTPMLMGRASSMNQVAVFAGLLFWSWVWGVWGMRLAVPTMMVVKVICDHVESLQTCALPGRLNSFSGRDVTCAGR